MADEAGSSILIVSLRYADDLATAVKMIGYAAQIERRAEQALAAFQAATMRVVVVDARGALAQGLAVALALGPAVEARRGAMLVLLSRADGSATAAVHDAGATSVLVSPFGNDAFGNALRMTVRNAKRLADVESLRIDSGDGDGRDRLTGLASGDQLQAAVAALLARPDASPVYVLAIGIGRIAAINAAYGRNIADQTLSAVAQRLSRLATERFAGKTVARLAAAEFAIALDDGAVMADATLLADAVIGVFAEPFLVGDHILHLSARIGIAASNLNHGAGECSPQSLIRHASAALATARSGEAGTISVFQPDPAGDPLTRRADLVTDLHRAIDAGDIMLLYQPQLSLAEGRIAGVEALARWEHRELGVLTAQTLLETAETADLAIRLGRHIRLRAMVAAATWTGPLATLKLSVNVTAADLADPGFTEALELALNASELPAQRLTLEVTEGALIGDIDAAARILERLRGMGIGIALDDFGTGFSSLAWMARLPIDMIKLDRSFMLGLMASERERVVVEGVVALARQLGLAVVCEGIEDAAQLSAAAHAGCDFVQGFQVAAPLRAERLQQFCVQWESVAA